MTFFRYIFSFLYTRNWHNGKMELSTPRVILMCAAIFLFVVAVLMIVFLQTPIEYRAL